MKRLPVAEFWAPTAGNSRGRAELEQLALSAELFLMASSGTLVGCALPALMGNGWGW